MSSFLLCNYEFPPMGGGAGNATAEIARQLVLMGHRVVVVTSRYGRQPRRELLHGVEVHRVPSLRRSIHDCGMRGAVAYVLGAYPTVRRLTRAERFDAIHYFFSLPTGLLCRLPGPHRRVPYVVSLRGSDVPGYDPYNRSLQVAHRLLRPVTRRIWRGAARVVALSQALCQIARETDATVALDVIPNGVDTHLFSPRQGAHPAAGPVRLLTVSRLIERKGIQHLLHALADLHEPMLSLEVVGEGNYRQALEKLVRELHLEGRVSFSGFRGRRELPDVFRSADVFVLPSLAESFGMVFAEAMASGLPIIGGRAGGVPDLVSQDCGVLVEPGNVAQIRAALVRLATDEPLRRRMGSAARQRVVEGYGWPRVAEAYQAHYLAAAGAAYPDGVRAPAGPEPVELTKS